MSMMMFGPRCQATLTSLSRQSRAQRRILVLGRSMSSAKQEDEVIKQTINNKGIITLNRPKALNALSLNMIRSMYCILKEWEKDKNLVIVKGAGGKAFCAGGDVRQVTLGGEACGKDYFREEYTLDNLIGSFHKPYVALIDGITMGGGVGISVNGQYRVATERTLFAMPETAIGLFPDVGGGHILPRLGGKLGLYLALTGHRLKGADVLKAGIATHYCESSKLPELEKALIECSGSPEETLKKFTQNPDCDFSLKPYLKQIDDIFSAPTVEEIFQRLEKDGTAWAADNLNTLKKMSPTSMKVSKMQLDFGANMDLQECLQMEYRIVRRCLQGSDFYEGVRALLIDKDQNPKWKPPTLEELSDAEVKKYFEPLPAEEELKL